MKIPEENGFFGTFGSQVWERSQPSVGENSREWEVAPKSIWFLKLPKKSATFPPQNPFGVEFILGCFILGCFLYRAFCDQEIRTASENYF